MAWPRVLGDIADDSESLHETDTLHAGAGLCDEDAVRVLVHEGPVRVRELIALGAQFDRDPDGTLQLAREGGHSFARVVHAGGAATGAEIERALVEATARTAAVVHEHTFARDLVIDHGHCRGLVVRDSAGEHVVRARHVLLATGGAGQLFALTTNPLEATGDGIALALRAGVAVADVEFMQFHPTALAIDRLPRPLLSEALRGDGALLRNPKGERFIDELQPRDIVSRAITAQMLEHGTEHVFLDVRPIADFARHFPSLAATLAAVGLDPAHDLLPVAPAAHYLSGGVLTDLDGASELAGLWAAGRGRVLGRARCEPARLELAPRRAGLRCSRGRCDRGREDQRGGHRGHAQPHRRRRVVVDHDRRRLGPRARRRRARSRPPGPAAGDDRARGRAALRRPPSSRQRRPSPARS